MGENRRIAPGLVSPEPLSRLPLGDAFGADVGFVNDFGMKDVEVAASPRNSGSTYISMVVRCWSKTVINIVQAMPMKKA